MPDPAGPVPQVWPFAALAPLEETLEWRTDVLAAQAGEQRIALRPVPREIVTLRHRLDGAGIARAIELARAGHAGMWEVPLWHMAAPVGALAAGTTEIAVDSSIADYRPGGRAAVVAGHGAIAPEARVFGIATVEPGGITLAAPLAARCERAVLAPVRAGVLTEGPRFERRRPSLAEVAITFTLVDGPQIAASALPQYRGLDMLTDAALTRRPLASRVVRPREIIDTGLGTIAVEPARDLTARGEAITLRDFGRARAWARRQWLWHIAGRLQPFWLPSWGRELVLQEAVAWHRSELAVAPIADPAAYVGRHIAIRAGTGLLLREITAAIADGPVHRLTLDAMLGVDAPASAPVHWLTRVRLDTDRVEISHGATAAEAAFTVIEVDA